jgi:hypothetical protein
MRLDVTDAGDRAVIEAARSWGVAPSILLGRQRTSTTTQWAGTTQTTHDAEWTDEDLGAALDLLAWEAALCPGCRYPLAETTAPENEERYFMPAEVRCHRCTASDQAQDRLQDRHSPSALLIPIELRPAPDAVEVGPNDADGNDGRRGTEGRGQADP